jgi:hypothetical protein
MKTAITFRPLESFPGKRPHPKRSPFRTTYGKTLDLLDRELLFLQARDVVIQLDCSERDIRNDGMPRSDCRPRSAAVVLSFESKKSGGPMQFPCAAFTSWQDNIRAIALSLESLRQVDRYGVTQHAEQYRGWSKLAGPAEPAVMTATQAAELLVTFGGGDSAEILRYFAAFQEAFKRAKVATHPDRNGGSEGQFKAVQAAGDVLERVFGQ